MSLIDPISPLVLTSSFGPRGPVTLPSGEVRPASFHHGSDFRAAIGTPVHAPEAGAVTKVNQTTRGGTQLFFQGLTHRWAFVHLSRVVVDPGTSVEAGTVLALSGNSGGVAPHLHVEADGGTVDPMTLLRPSEAPAPSTTSKAGGGLLLALAGLFIASRFF